MGQQLYILNDESNAIPVSWGAYEEWESRIKREQRSVLGKKLRCDTVGNTSVVTYFISTPIGFYGRKPQLWVTIASGAVNNERVYTSHRAAINGHLAELRELRKQNVLSTPCKVIEAAQEYAGQTN
jgi:hypothetical protein